MKVYKIQLSYKQYQIVKLPPGAAPLTIDEDGQDQLALFFIGPDSLLGVELQDFGVFVIATDTTIPSDVRLFPVPHPLTGLVEPPNARYVATVHGYHIVMGNPRVPVIDASKLRI